MNSFISYYLLVSYALLFYSVIKRGYNIPNLSLKELFLSLAIILFWLPVSIYLFIKQLT